jgi:hypothetical protein
MAQVTFTHKTWDAAFAEMAKIKPDAELIGWFHSHPNFGVFLSDHDKFIQTQFFAPDGRITIVVDPIRGKRGWFISRDKEVVPYAKEEDTTLEKLGESSTDPEINIPAIAGNRTSGGIGLGRVIAISGIFSLLSMFGGFTLASSSNNNSVQIGNLERQVAFVLGVLEEKGLISQPVEPETVEPTVQPTTQAPTPTPSTTAKSSPKASKSPDGSKKTKIMCYKTGEKDLQVIAVQPKCPPGFTTAKPAPAVSPAVTPAVTPAATPTPKPSDDAPDKSTPSPTSTP